MDALTEPRRGSNGNTPQDPEQGRNGEHTTTEEMTMKQCNADGQRGRSDWAEETQSREPTAESREPTGCVISRLSASGPRRASLWRRLRPRENAATRLRGARACLALLAAAALLALAAPAQAQTEVWTATLTPTDLGHGILGCSNNIATGRCSSTTFLSEDSFNHDSTDYNITGLYVRSSGRFEILVNADLTTATAALTGSATERLWSAHDARGLGADNEFEAAGQLAMDAGYGVGLPGNRGVLTPYAGMTLGDAGARTVRTGTRWQLNPDTVVSVEATRQASDGSETANQLTLRAAVRF